MIFRVLRISGETERRNITWSSIRVFPNVPSTRTHALTMTSSRIADDSDDHHELVGSAASNVFDEVFSPPARGMEQEMGLFGHAALDLGWAGRLEGPLESSIDDQSDIYGLPLSDMDIDSVLNASLTGVLEGITASSRDELLSAFELEMEPSSQALSCPSSPYGEAAAWRSLAVPNCSPIVAPSTTTSCPVSPAAPRPRSVSSVRAGQSLLKPSVLTAIRQKAAAAASSATTQLAPPPDRHRASGALATTGRYWIARSKSGAPLSTAAPPAPVRNRSCKSRRSTVSGAARSRSPPCQLSRSATAVKSLGIKRALATAFHTSRRTASPVADTRQLRCTASAAQPTSPSLVASETVIENMDVSEYILPVDSPAWAPSDTLLTVDCPSVVGALSPGRTAADPTGLLMACPPPTPAATQLPGFIHSQVDIPSLPTAASSDGSFCDPLQLLDDVAGVIAEDVVIVDGPVDDYTDFRIAADNLAADPPDLSAATECAPDSNVVIVNLSAESKRCSFKTDDTAIVDDTRDAAATVVGVCGVVDNCGDITTSAGGCDSAEIVCDSALAVAMEVSCKSVPVADDGSCCVAADEVNSVAAGDNVSRATAPITDGEGNSCSTHLIAALKVDVERDIVSPSVSAVDSDVPFPSDLVDDILSDTVEEGVSTVSGAAADGGALALAVGGDASDPAEGGYVSALVEDGDILVATENDDAAAPVEADMVASAETVDVTASKEAVDVIAPAEAVDVAAPAEAADVTVAAVAGGVSCPSDYANRCKSGSELLQQLQGRLDGTRSTTARDLIGAELQRLSERLLVGRTRAKHINQRFTRRSFHCTEEEVPFPPTESASLPTPPLIKAELLSPSLSKSKIEPSPLSNSKLLSPSLSKPNLQTSRPKKLKLQPPSLSKSMRCSVTSKPKMTSPLNSKPNLQSPSLGKAKIQSSLKCKPKPSSLPLSKPTLRSPMTSKPSLQSPSLNKSSLQFPSLSKPSLQSPSLSKPFLQSPSLSKPSLQSPSLSKPSLQSETFNKVKQQSMPLSKPKRLVASVKLNTFHGRPETRSSRRLQLVNVQRMSQSGERDCSAAPVHAAASLNPDDCAAPGCVSSSTELPVSPSEVVVQNCHSEVVMADHSYSNASGGGEGVRALGAGGAVAAGSSFKRKITLSEYKQRIVTSVSSRPGSPERDGRGWPEPPTLLSTGLPDLPLSDQLRQGAVESLSDQLGQGAVEFPADQLGQGAAVPPVDQQSLSDQLGQGSVAFPVGQQPISDQAAKLEAIICASPPQSSVAAATAGSSAHIAYAQLLQQHATSNTAASARSHGAVNNNSSSGRVANSCGGSDMSPTASSISAPDSGMSISSGSPRCPPLSPADPFRYVPEQYSAASSTPATSDHSRASSVTKAVIRSERHRSPARRHRAHRRRRSRSSSSSSGSSPSPARRPRRSRQRSRSPLRPAVRRQPPPSEKQKRHRQMRLEQQEAIERRVIYVNGLHAEVNESKLLAMFAQFGDITRVKIKERKYPHVVYGDSMSRCYAFITYSTQQAAVDAQNYANVNYPDLEVRFGGRREFCLDQYQDTDNVSGGVDGSSRAKETDFDTLLEMEMRRIQESNSQHAC